MNNISKIGLLIIGFILLIFLTMPHRCRGGTNGPLQPSEDYFDVEANWDVPAPAANLPTTRRRRRPPPPPPLPASSIPSPGPAAVQVYPDAALPPAAASPFAFPTSPPGWRNPSLPIPRATIRPAATYSHLHTPPGELHEESTGTHFEDFDRFTHTPLSSSTTGYPKTPFKEKNK